MSSKPRVTDSSGNVFVDLRVLNPADEDTKMDLAVAINDAIAAKALRQVDAAGVMGVKQPQVSALANYRLSGFSVGRLIDCLTALGRDVEIGYRPTLDGAPGHARVRELEPA